MRRPSPVGGEQWRRGLSQTEAPEPGEEPGTSIIGAPIFDGLAAPVAPNVGGHGIRLVGGLAAIGHITLETEHEGYLQLGTIGSGRALLPILILKSVAVLAVRRTG